MVNAYNIKYRPFWSIPPLGTSLLQLPWYLFLWCPYLLWCRSTDWFRQECDWQRSGGEGWLYISGTINMLYCLDIAVYLVVSLSLSLNGTFTFYFWYDFSIMHLYSFNGASYFIVWIILLVLFRIIIIFW